MNNKDLQIRNSLQPDVHYCENCGAPFSEINRCRYCGTQLLPQKAIPPKREYVKYLTFFLVLLSLAMTIAILIRFYVPEEENQNSRKYQPRQQLLKNKKSKKPVHQTHQKQQKHPITTRSIKAFPKADSTWGSKLTPEGKLPNSGFLAFYINTEKPEEVIARDQVESISVNHIHSNFNNIRSEDFGAYWVGSINIPKEKTVILAVSQGWAKSRIIIDGRIVYEGAHSKELPLQMEKGFHKVEVEYVNNWHTINFSVSFLEKRKKYSNSEITNQLKTITTDYQIYNVGVYKSKNMDHSITLYMKKTDKPVVLFLSSYNGIKWVISNPHQVKIAAVVYGSYEPGVSVTGNIEDSTLRLISKKQLSNYSLSSKCSCAGSYFYCEDEDGLKTIKKLETIGRAKVAGFSGQYSATTLDVPEKIVNKEFIASLEQIKKDNEILRKTCERNNNPNFEKLFNRQ